MNKLLGVVLVLAGCVSAFGQSSGGNRGGGGSVFSGTTGQSAVYTSGTALGSSPAQFDATAYAGATVDVKVNACITAAMAVNGICDARGLGGTQTVAAEIDVGDSAGDAVGLLLPISGTWTGTAVDGASSVIKQWGNTSIIGYPTGGSDCTFSFRAGGSSSLNYVYSTDTAANHYLYARGFCVFAGAGTNHVTVSGIGAFFSAAFDNSVWEYITVNDRVDTYAAKIEAVCCSAMFDHIQFQSNFTAGLTPLWINQIDGELKSQDLTISHSSVNHPGATFPSIKITDTSTAHVLSVNLVDDYIEPSNTDTTTAFITVSGAGAVNISNLTVHCMATGSTASAVTVDNTATSMLNVTALSFLKGGATCTYPVAAAISDASLANAQTNTIPTDSVGNIPRYHSGLGYSNRTQIVSNGAASASPFSMTGTPFTGGSGTTTFPFFYLASGTAPTAFSTSGTMFAINAPNAFAGNLLDFYVNGTAEGNLTAAGAMIMPSYRTIQNCAGVGTSANPSVVTCSSAAAGAVSCSNSATGGTCVINTSKVTANSEIIIQQVVDEGARLSVTCNTASALPAGPLLASKSAATSFTINLGTVTTNPACFDFWIVN